MLKAIIIFLIVILVFVVAMSSNKNNSENYMLFQSSPGKKFYNPSYLPGQMSYQGCLDNCMSGQDSNLDTLDSYDCKQMCRMYSQKTQQQVQTTYGSSGTPQFELKNSDYVNDIGDMICRPYSDPLQYQNCLADVYADRKYNYGWFNV